MDLDGKIHYDPETGRFCWTKNSRFYGRPFGDIHAGYLRVGFNGSRYRAHRLAWLIMTGELPSGIIDHINGDKLDNRWCNLRIADHAQNAANCKKYENNTSGFKGVDFHKKTGKWRARCTFRGRRYSCGYFDNQEDAARAYDKKMFELHDEFARLNFDEARE